MRRAAATALVAVAVACSSTSSNLASDAGAEAAVDAGPPACSKGPALACQLVFPKRPISDQASLPACTPRCDAKAPLGGWYALDGLPTGACDREGYRCTIGIQYIWCGLVNGMECDCTNGEWSCAIVSQGGAACSCDCNSDFGKRDECDGGTDATPD